MEHKMVLVLPKSSGLNAADRDALREGGIIVVTVKEPSQVKMLTPEMPPMSSNDLLRAALTALMESGDFYKSKAWVALSKAMLEKG